MSVGELRVVESNAVELIIAELIVVDLSIFELDRQRLMNRIVLLSFSTWLVMGNLIRYPPTW
ncbi:MAG: hypothetical protein WBF93_14325 [Pirellulales bacterium]|nr:hypothetical protein [Pirellulales bacterium]